jgi:hypothetical protein
LTSAANGRNNDKSIISRGYHVKSSGPSGQDDQRTFSGRRFTVLFALFTLLIFVGMLVLYAQRSGIVQRSLYEGSRELLTLQKEQHVFEHSEDIQKQYDGKSRVPRQTMFIDPASSVVLYNTRGTGHGYPDSTGVLMKNEHPDVWAAMSSSEGSGMFLSHDGLYVFDKIMDFKRTPQVSSGFPCKIAVFITTETLAGEYYRIQRSFFLPFALLLALAALASWQLARIKPRKR